MKKTITDRSAPQAFAAERLMEHIRHLSVIIGPRRPASMAERAAAEYIHETVRPLGEQWELINQPFQSVRGFRYRIAPLALFTGLLLLLGLRKDRESQLVSGLLSVGLSVMSRDAFLARPSVWETWMPRGESENVVVRIPPRRPARRRIVFLAHVDSGVHRLTTSSAVVRYLPRTLGGITLMGLVGGVLTMLAGRQERWKPLRATVGVSALGAALLAMVDESGPDVAGANGNASGVAVLLALAEALYRRPLESTEVVLAFTGSGTATSTGADVLATEFGQAWSDALWIVVDSVGTGELCWATRHGISPYAYYHPHPEAVQVMECVAQARPDLGLMGKPMLTLDEVVILRDRDLRAVALMGYDRVTGLIPNWRQSGDTIHAIDPATVERAAEAAWTAALVVDRADNWPLCR